MPATYTDILLGKLSLQYQILSAAQLHECLNALEAGQRAGIAQTLTQVLVKRGYLTRSAQRDLDVAVQLAERGRRAKLIVQLLLKHGRPGENVLKAYYESLKSQGFPLDLAQALEQFQQITKEERAGLESAVERAVPSLIQREAEELAQTVDALRKAPPQADPDAPPPLSVGAASAAYRATGMRQALSPEQLAALGPLGAGSGAMSGPIPAVAAVAAQYRATGMRQAYPGMEGAPPSPPYPQPGQQAPQPARQTGMRQAFNADGSGTISGPVAQPYGGSQPLPPPPTRQTGMRAAYVMGPDGTPVAVAMAAQPQPMAPHGAWPGAQYPQAAPMPQGYVPMGPAGYQQAPQGYVPAPHGYPGVAPQYGMTAQRAAMQGANTVERGAYAQLMSDVPQHQLAAPPPMAQPYQAPAMPPGAAPPGGPGPGGKPPQFGRTVERAAADMKVLPAWAKTGVRKINPEDIQVPAKEEPKGGKKDNLQEPQGPVPGYEMQEKIGKGRIGVIYRALEKESGRIVALKIMYPIFLKNPALVERFKREAAIASKLDHPNIRRVYSGGEAGGHLYVAMEMVEGETLQEKIDKQTVLPEADTLRWIAQIARAMDHYSRTGLMHRDVKPEHVLITKDGRALLCELGMSKKAYEEYAQTVQGTSFGSPYYVSPEQGMGVVELDIRSDIYSLGVTLFHCLTGRVPFLGGNAGVIISKHATEAIPDVRKLNPKLTKGAQALIERMMAKKREDRHQAPKELLAEIAWLRSESGIAATPIVPLDPPTSDEKQVEAAPKRRSGFFGRMLRAVGIGK